MQQESIIIRKVNAGEAWETQDILAVEEPLEIQVCYSTATGRMNKNISVTMRTPGHDAELAAGFLFTEGIIPGIEAIEKIQHIGADENRILVTLRQDYLPVLNNADRNFYATSSCGICGKASIEMIRTLTKYNTTPGSLTITPNQLQSLPNLLRKKQEVFEHTGGIHACALFDVHAELMMLREDVGRHNALDKLIGAAAMQQLLPLHNYILLLSGRASFELIQKAAMAEIKMIAAVGAPSTLAVELAKELNITLIGFLRNERFNIYSGEQRILL
ncbi:MAG: formate dehydrogenase accessory sulfurtransferase FdhD [Bacteroidetes bacterium]|nr:formate dehydrogenase accessory sulfurtransferase FdhD [Bacteroidota bacterium]